MSSSARMAGARNAKCFWHHRSSESGRSSRKISRSSNTSRTRLAGTAVWVIWEMVEALLRSPGRWTAQRMRMRRPTEPTVRDGQPRSSAIRAARLVRNAANSRSSNGSLLLTPRRLRGMSNSMISVQRGGTECNVTLVGSGGACRGGGPPRDRRVPMMNSWCPVRAAAVRSTRVLLCGPAIRPAWRRQSRQTPSMAATSRWQMSQCRLVAFATKHQHALQRGRSNQPHPRQSRQLRVAQRRERRTGRLIAAAPSGRSAAGDGLGCRPRPASPSPSPGWADDRPASPGRAGRRVCSPAPRR